MRKKKYTVKPTSQFKKDCKLAMKRRLDMKLLEDVVTALAMGETLPERHKDRAPCPETGPTVRSAASSRTGF